MAMSFTPDLPYWYEINIYRTAEQRFVLAIRLFFQSETEEDTTQAWEFETMPEVFDAIEQYDAGQDVKVSLVDAPPAASAELAAMALELRARLHAARANFAGLVGELFEELEAAMGVSG
jgi:RPA family protein